jgi:hypothetical protein
MFEKAVDLMGKTEQIQRMKTHNFVCLYGYNESDLLNSHIELSCYMSSSRSYLCQYCIL